MREKRGDGEKIESMDPIQVTSPNKDYSIGKYTSFLFISFHLVYKYSQLCSVYSV